MFFLLDSLSLNPCGLFLSGDSFRLNSLFFKSLSL